MTTTATAPAAPALTAGVVYFGDNGAAMCADCAGYTARTTGTDLSGQPVVAATYGVALVFGDAGIELVCECGAASGIGQARTETVTMADVKPGDVLYESGLRCEVTGTDTYESATGYGHGTARTVHVARSRITNPAYLSTEGGRFLFGGIIPRDGSSGWTFQGIACVPVCREVAPG